jgi:hypothetical protein
MHGPLNVKHNLFQFMLIAATTRSSAIFYYLQPSFLRIAIEYKIIYHTFMLYTLPFTHNISLQPITPSMGLSILFGKSVLIGMIIFRA